MPLQSLTTDFLNLLQRNPATRAQIRATPGKTLLYAGNFFKPVWQEIEEVKRRLPQAADKETLQDALSRIALPGASSPNILLHVKSLERRIPWKPDGFIVWRALSGIFAANAQGAVSFMIGTDVTRDNKVFAATEIAVLARNPRVDATTKDLLSYYARCVQNKQSTMNLGFLAG